MNTLIRSVEKTLKDNAPAILTSLGVSGTITTAYLAAKASFRAGWIINEEERVTARPVERKDAVKAVWKLYIPAGISGALTIGCIIGATKVSARRSAAAYSLLAVSEKALAEYQEKVVEQIGEKKEQAIRDEIAQDRINAASTPIIVSGSGNVLCYEMHTGRYFNCDMETLRKAQNTINAQLISQMTATLSDFYYLIGLEQTDHSGYSGWTSDKMLDLTFSAVIAQDGKPCIAFGYNYVKQL
jgi:Family of unknown function (DUF6353)